MVLWPSCFAKFMVVLPNISLQIPQCDYAHIRVRVVLTQRLRSVHPTRVLILPSLKAEALMCLGIGGGSWPSANLVTFLRFKSLHQVYLNLSNLDHPIFSTPCATSVPSFCEVKSPWVNRSSTTSDLNSFKMTGEKISSLDPETCLKIWCLPANWKFNWLPIELKDPLPEKKKRIELMRGRFSGPFHLPRIFPSFPLNQWDFHQPDKFWKDGSSCRSAGCPAKC